MFGKRKRELEAQLFEALQDLRVFKTHNALLQTQIEKAEKDNAWLQKRLMVRNKQCFALEQTLKELRGVQAEKSPTLRVSVPSSVLFGKETILKGCSKIVIEGEQS